MHALTASFFDRDAQEVARDLLGKVLAHRADGRWLCVRIVEAEAYYLHDRGSHASLGYTEKRRALFMPPGTVYMYYARGGDSLNFSCRGEGNAVLVKAGVPHLEGEDAPLMLEAMHRRNPLSDGRRRADARLCSGQTLLCRALGLRVPEWDGRSLTPGALELWEVGYRPAAIVRTTRLGIPPGRDPHLPYRFIDRAFVQQATHNPLTRRSVEGRDYVLLPPSAVAPEE